ncbi:MAG TPA: hypothetical protein VE343_01510 [Streptosporangiaceae bacterium]|jgi:hypothetical protein|nr:hypothetical protein [Streptosporangiaceae bacterium]
MTLRDTLIGIHAAGGTVAFGAGVILVRQAASRGPGRVPVMAYLAGMVLLAATAAALTGTDWAGLGPAPRAVLATLTGFAVVLAGVASRARRLLRARAPGWRPRFTEAVGFTLIALFDGFVIIAALDLGAPGWAVAVVAVAAVLAGRRVIQHASARAARSQDQPVPPRSLARTR